MNNENDNSSSKPDKPVVPSFPTDRIELNDIPIIPKFPNDRIEKGEKPSDIKKKDN